MLGYKTDDSITSIDNSEDDYVPGPSGSSEEDNSDDFSEPKTRVVSSKHVDLVSEGDRSDKIARKNQYKKTNKRCRSSSEENGSNGESELKRKKQYANTYKRCTSSPMSNTSSESLLVMNVSEVDGSKKYHQKKHFCLFCEQPQSKIARHLQRKHIDEMEVATALRFAKRSKARRLHLNLLRKKGNRAHNIQALKEGKGVLVPCKQTSDDKTNHQDYQHCFACHGLFKRKSMRKHVARCTLAQNVRKEMPGKTRIQALCANAQPVAKGVSEKVWKLVSNMAQDDVAHAVKQDRYILALGEKMYNKKGENPSQHQHIRQTLRELGRLVIKGRKMTPLKKMKDYINPQHFQHIIKAVKEVTGYDEKTNKFEKATLATKLGQSIQKIADIMEGEALITRNEEKLKLVRDFQGIYRLRWNEMISSAAYRTLEQKKWNAPQLIPLADDVKKIHMYLDEKQKQYYNQLCDEKNSRKWSNLAKVILAQMIIFNRKREGEVSKMSVATFHSRDKSPLNKDVAVALTEVERLLCAF